MKSIIKKSILSSLVLVVLTCSIAGQGYNENIFFDKHLRPETPGVSQFLRYDEMPVSEYTGIPEISIPIYDMNIDGLKIPVKLTYHAGGIKVDQEASWVGLGWDLSMGSIVQIINDEDDLNLPYKIDARNIQRLLPDFPNGSCVSYYPIPTTTPTYFPLYETKRKNIVKITTDFHVPINGKYQKEGHLFDDYSTYPEYRDSEPDIFKVFLPTGELLNFIIDWNTNKFVVLNKKGYIINRTGNSWTVTNPYGDRFNFSTYLESYNTITGGFGGQGVYDIRKTTQIWLLSSIITRNGKYISFEYEVTPVTSDFNNNNYTTAISHSSVMKFNVLSDNTDYLNFISNYSPHVFSFDNNNTPPFEGTYYITNRTFESLFHLKKIIFPNGQINFTLSPRMDKNNQKKLDKIVVSNNIGDIINTLDFSYSYFSKPTGTGIDKLKLISIRNNAEQYRFKYDETTLPSNASYSQDCWGYYNGHTNTSLIPNPSRYILPSGWTYKPNNNNNMSANLPYTKMRILTEIQFPTGGKVEYEYESNTFDNYPIRVPDYDEAVSTTMVGITKGLGLRVKNIKYKDIQGNIVKQEQYQYSSGKAIFPKKFFRQKEYWVLDVTTVANNTFRVRDRRGIAEEINVNGFSIFNPLSSFNGVGYGIVSKKVISDNANDNSKIDTYYSNHPDIIDLFDNTTLYGCSPQEDDLVAFPAYKNERYPQNGTINYRKIYNANNEIVRSEDYDYDNDLSPTFYGARTSFYSYFVNITRMFEVTELSLTHRNTVSFYPIFDFEVLLTKTTTKDYFNGQTVEASETYEYDELNRLKNTIFETGNTLDKRITLYTYPRLNWYAETDLVNRNFINEPVNIEIKNGVNKSLSHIWKFYLNQNVGGCYDQIHPQFVEKRFGENNPVADRISYQRYDWHNNPIQIKIKDNEPTSYVWSYKSAYPILEIKNATYDEAENAANSNQKFMFKVFDGVGNQQYPFLPAAQLYPTDAEIWQLGETLRTNLPNAEVTTYTYKPLVGVTSITDPRGVKTSYNYDNYSRLINIKDNSDKKIESFDYLYVKDAKPVITSHSVNVNKVSITYFGCSSLTYTAIISYQVIPGSSISGSSAGGCNGTASITVPYSNTNYRITIKLITSAGFEFEDSIEVFVP